VGDYDLPSYLPTENVHALEETQSNSLCDQLYDFHIETLHQGRILPEQSGAQNVSQTASSSIDTSSSVSTSSRAVVPTNVVAHAAPKQRAIHSWVMTVIAFRIQGSSGSKLQVTPPSFPNTKGSRLLKADMFTTPFRHREPGGRGPALHSPILYPDQFTMNTGCPSNRPVAMSCPLVG